MPKLPVVSGAEAIAAFESVGYERARTKGDHVRLKCSGRASLTVPLHDPVKRGLIRDAGMSVEEFCEHL
ncbi:MAG: type II toxin-antitoxin system HicA family toxin [Rubrobacteraceae bacterium]|jgi:predicted RNA binding protein YcfA (HicA-like mRNA interferase family)|nr:type II toxin-antitoxin system HicA family toxin [Rubrobacter sp.]